MMFLHTLRLAGDLSFYYAFAGFFAASFGGTPMPLVLVWPALCFGLASCFEGSRPLRTTLAALSAAALLFLPTGADKLCYFPAAVYPVLLAYTGDFALSPVRQAELQLLRNFPTGHPLRRTDRRQLETNRRTRERHHTNDLMGRYRPRVAGCRRRAVPVVHRRNKVGKQSGGFVK